MRGRSAAPITRLTMLTLRRRNLHLRAGGATIFGRPPASGGRRVVRRLIHLLGQQQRGFSLIEVVFALVLFEIAGASLIGVLTSATAASKVARQGTVAQQTALSQIESVRTISDYKQIGLVNGNPSGCIGVTTPTAACPNSSYPPATATITKGGVTATVTTQVSFVNNDPNPLAYSNYASYKKVVVTVTRTSDSKQLAQEITYVAPPVKADATNATINATVVDYGNNASVPNVPVALSTGPSAPENDTTNASGLVTFAGLTPNPGSGPQQYYDLSVTPPGGYVTLYDTVSPKPPAHVQLTPAQTWPTSLYVYKPATITSN